MKPFKKNSIINENFLGLFNQVKHGNLSTPCKKRQICQECAETSRFGSFIKKTYYKQGMFKNFKFPDSLSR
jgi:hypothetical protein